MAEPFKNLLGPAVVKQAARHLQRAWAGFDAKRFSSLALDGLEALEMKARAMHVCVALEATLPADFNTAAGVLEAALAPAPETQAFASMHLSDQGLGGWALWPVAEFVARRGLGQPERALETLHAITQRFTAEWAVRPFIVAHPELTYRTLARWALDPSPHVRRLVSEGSRPRLPWGLQLKSLVADPSPTLPLLIALQDDASDYVRRSVANHLNDIAKDHPEVVAAWIEAHLPDAPPERARLLRHAARTLIKAGDRRVLKAFGLGKAFRGSALLSLSPHRVALGTSVQLEVALSAGARVAQKLAIDYAVHHVKANGGTSAKVFKGWVLTLGAGEQRTLTRRHAVKPITTRRYHAGTHHVELLVNGQPVAEAAFELLMPSTPAARPPRRSRP
ncbi:MAG TPA: DNA alkylation repair protein [Rubrivivax sp.]